MISEFAWESNGNFLSGDFIDVMKTQVVLWVCNTVAEGWIILVREFFGDCRDGFIYCMIDYFVDIDAS